MPSYSKIAVEGKFIHSLLFRPVHFVKLKIHWIKGYSLWPSGRGTLVGGRKSGLQSQL